MNNSQTDVRKGVIFRSGTGDVFLGSFDNGQITTFNSISDFDGVYDKMLPEKIHLVDISYGEGDSFWIKDLGAFEVGGHDESGEFIPGPVEEMLNELQFPSEETDNMFNSFLNDIGKSN